MRRKPHDMKLIMESWRGFVNEDNSVTRSTNEPKLKSDLKSMLKKSKLKEEIEVAVVRNSLPKTADEYLDEWIDVRLKDWDGNKTTMDDVRKTPLGKNNEFIEWFKDIVYENKQAGKAPDDDPMKIVDKMLGDGKTDAEIDKELTKRFGMSYADANLLRSVTKKQRKLAGLDK